MVRSGAVSVFGSKGRRTAASILLAANRTVTFVGTSTPQLKRNSGGTKAVSAEPRCQHETPAFSPDAPRAGSVRAERCAIEG
jgi:hypothetical protein